MNHYTTPDHADVILERIQHFVAGIETELRTLKKGLCHPDVQDAQRYELKPIFDTLNLVAERMEVATHFVGKIITKAAGRPRIPSRAEIAQLNREIGERMKQRLANAQENGTPAHPLHCGK